MLGASITAEKRALRAGKVKTISLHLNVLSRLALGRDISVTLHAAGKGTYADINEGTIFIDDLSDDVEVLIGLGFHELAHVIATEGIDYKKEGVPERDIKGVHRQLNSLEDFRIENRVAQLYPPSEYYLDKFSRFFRLEHAHTKRIGDMVQCPSYLLHLNLGNIDLSKFVPNPEKKTIREIAADLKARKIECFPSTKALFPVAWDVYKKLKPFAPKGEDGEFDLPIPGRGTGDPDNECNGGKSRKKAVFAEIPDGMVLSQGKPGEAAKGEPTFIVPETEMGFKISKHNEEKGKEIPLALPPIKHKQKIDYARPYDPKITVMRLPDSEICDDDGIFNEGDCASEGKQIGLKLIQELKMADGARHYQDEGELDVMDVLQNLQENRGKLASFDVFSDNAPLIHDHTVLVLIDMSASMSGDRICMARGAALMLVKALEEMNVMYSIRGFSAHSGQLEINDVVIKEFDEPLDINKLRKMNAGGDNRDSDSIRNATNIIRGERGKKLIFVISDGQPNHCDGIGDYRAFNQQCEEDVHQACLEAEKEGISVIGIGITPEAVDCISKNYLKGFAVLNWTELPAKLLKIYLQETAGLRKAWHNTLI